MDPTSPGRLQGRVAVVTGGSSGLGRAGALRFAAEGARVAVGSVQPEQGAAVVAEIEAADGEAAFRETDVRRPDDVAALIADAEQRWGRIDVLYASAGATSPANVSSWAWASSAGTPGSRAQTTTSLNGYASRSSSRRSAISAGRPMSRRLRRSSTSPEKA